MTFSAPEPVASGRPYRVIDVAGATPRSLSQFAGEARFGIERGGTVSWIKGFGTDTDGCVRFHEKDLDHSGKDVRVWLIRHNDAGQFTAETVSAY